jgi:hypothetical protein
MAPRPQELMMANLQAQSQASPECQPAPEAEAAEPSD